jgi:nickel/cobalt transporter (NicO) family protein
MEMNVYSCGAILLSLPVRRLKKMWQILIGSVSLSVIHALIPNHWIPLLAIGRSEKWTNAEILSATGIAGIAHITSTVIIGIIVGFAGFRLSSSFETITTVIAPVILAAIGVTYLVVDYVQSRHHHHHEHIRIKSSSGKSKFAILLSLSFAMFLSPCLELEAYYFQAGTAGWAGIIMVSIVYMLVTVSAMIILVWLGLKGMNRLKSDFLEHHNKRITGIVLILLGILAMFVKL